MSKPTVPEVLPLVNDIYERHSAGCCLHVVLDDLNVDNKFVDMCVNRAIEQGHEDCFVLALKLSLMSKTQRVQLSRRHK